MTEDPPLASLPLQAAAFTPWFTRVVAFVIDWAPIGLVWSVPFLVMLAAGDTQCISSVYFGAGDPNCSSGAHQFWTGFLGFALLLVVAYPLWNNGYRQGTTGQSVGKSLMRFQVVSEKDWQPIGFWRSVLRQLAHNIDVAVCYLGYLLPLVDKKRQTIADKIMGTVCVPVVPALTGTR
ncbi:RDD family protein [Mycobacterium sp. 3519A]|uniref:RDD family protein n=1 Tax=Mycobacterium sp. 3519A TaxID=2057184 RepID=UPI000C7E1C3D|nr:RDD family protein [Mycobacterium sp. 3519A]